VPDLTVTTANQPVTLEARVTVDGAPTDPTSGQKFRVRKPDGTIQDLGTGTNVGGGSGLVRVVFDSPVAEGDYWWSFESTVPKSYEEHLFVAKQQRVAASMGLDPAALTTLPHARLYVQRAIGSGSFDSELGEMLINSYSAAVIRYCERQFRPVETAATKTFAYRGRGFLSFAPYDLRNVTAMSFGGAGVTTTPLVQNTDYTLEPRGQTPEGTYLYATIRRDFLPWPVFGWPQVVVTGDWGMPAVPADVEQATLIAIADGYRNPEGAASRGLGELAYQEVPEPVETAGRSLPPDARALLTPYRRLVLA
jgi:hypothetical protein